MFLTIFPIPSILNYPTKSELKIGDFVQIEIYQRGETKNESGRISEFLTKVDSHPRGIKVRLHNSIEGRVTKKMNGQILRDSDNTGDFYEGANQTSARRDQIEHTNVTEEEPTIEFKETFSLDTKELKFRKEGKFAEADGRKAQGKTLLKEIQKEVSIACAAFANTNSGILEIGKTDDGKISEYFEIEKKKYKNWDEYTRTVIQSIEKFTNDSTFALSIKILNSSGQQDALRLKIPRSKYPIFINDGNVKEEFYVRSNAAAQSQKIIKMAEQMRYCKEHFPEWKP